MPFDDFGVVGGLFTTSNNYLATTTADGNTVVFFQSGANIDVQLFDPTGQAIGTSSLLSSFVLPNAAVGLSNGNIAVSIPGSSVVRVFDPSMQFQLFTVAPSAASSINTDINITEVPGGGFAMSWSRTGTGTNSTDVEFQIFDNDGNSSLGPITLSLPGVQSSATVAYDNSLGGSSDLRLFFVDNTTGDLMYQAYSSNGATVGTVQQVTFGNTVTEYEVVTLANDTHVVIWEDSAGVHVTRLSSAVSPVPITNPLDSQGLNPTIVATADGGYIAAWVQATFSGNSAEVRQFDANGTLVESQSFTFGQAVEIAVTDDGILSIFVRTSSSTLPTRFFTIDSNNASFSTGNDTETADNNDNILHGLGGDDTINGEGGNDIITGGTGEDTLNGGSGDDHFYETGPSSEIDQYDGGSQEDTLFAIGEFYSNTVEFNLTTGRQSVGGVLRDTITNIENLTIGGDATIIGDGGDNILTAFDNGDVGDNTISGEKGNDTLFGGGGNDTLFGGDDDDELHGDAGNDTLNGGDGKNTIFGGIGDDTIVSDGGIDQIDGGDGTDTLDYTFYDNGSQINLIQGEAENQSHIDEVINVENVTAGDGNDDIIGGDEDNHFIGNDGNDQFTGGLGNDVFDGGAGDDEVNYSDSAQAVTINLATGSTSGGTAQADTYISIEDVRGSNFDDTLIGDSQANRLSGAGGDDLLDGGLGADVLIGGANTSVGDTVTYAASAGTVIVNLTTGGVGNHADGDSYSGIENVIGTDFQDSITGNGSNNALFGGLGDDFLFGEGGDDLLEGLDGGDTLTGGTGVDTVTYENSNAGVMISLIDDTASGGHATGDDLNEIENIIGTDFADNLVGNTQDNRLEGGGENDTLQGGLGADTLIGGAGFDTASYADSTVGVTVSLRDGMPVGVGGTAEGDTLTGIEGLIGSAFDDTLTGQENLVEDFIDAGDGNDIIFTRGGDDTIIAGAGNDHIIIRLNGNDALANSGDVTGGLGSDTLDFSATSVSVNSEIVADLTTQSMTYISRPNTVSEFIVADEVTFSGIESLVGASSQDHLTGDSGNNTLRGLVGNDTLIGGAGADILDGGDDNDTVDYSTSSAGVNVDLTAGTGTGGDAQGDTLIDIEFVIGTDHNDVVRGNQAPNRFTLGQGNDTAIVTNLSFLNDFDGGAGIDTISFQEVSGLLDIDLDLVNGSVGLADIIGFENVIDNTNNNEIVGNELANTFTITGGDDDVDGLGGTDSLVLGGDVRDWAMRLLNATESWIVNTATGDRVTFQSIERIFAGSNEVGYQISTGFGAALNGTNQSDILIGDAGGNAINGFGGDDILFGREGNDTIDGGAGFDRAVIEAQLLDYSFSLGSSGQIIATDNVGSAGTDILTNIEMIQFNQSFVADLTLNLTVITGNNGNNNLMGSALDEIIIGGDGNDNLVAVGGNDALFGGGDDDTLFSGSGADLLDGGSGNDTADYSQSDAGVRVRLGTTGNPTDLGYATGDVLVNIENITGSDFDDELLGDNGVNILRGGDGNDILNGFDGDDIFHGGEGDDTSVGGSGDDLFFGSAGADSFNGGNGGETIGDTVDYSSSSAGITANIELGDGFGGDAEGDSYTRIERVIGSQFDDVFVGASGAQTFIGGDGIDTISYFDSASRVVVNLLTNVHSQVSAAGDDLIGIENIIGTFSNDNLTGDAGNNVIEAWTGNNTINGGDGIDTAAYTLANTGVSVDLSQTTVQSTGISTDTISNIENLRGSDFDDVLRGNSGVNLLEGGLGDDILEGRGNGDTLDGGAGVDTASYENAGTGVTVNMGSGVHSGPDAAGDMFISIENLIGSGFADTLTGDANANVIEGGLGADNLDGGDGLDTASYAGASSGVTVSLALQGVGQNTGVTGTDTLNNFENLLGSIHADTLTGDGNANTIEGGLGDDTIDGGGGSDTASYVNNEFGVVVDLTQQGVAQDTLNAGLDTLIGIENLQGSDAGDTFTGDTNANVLIGAGGVDTIDGGDGADTIFGGTDGDTLNGQDGSDTIFGQEGNDTILGGAETDFLLGGDGVDTIFGEDGADQLFGENGDDTLFGQEGDDILLGGIGNDVLVGGEGTDTFFGEDGNDQLFGEGGGDVLFGQNGTDIIIAGTGGDFAFGGDDTDTIYGEDGNDQLFGENGGDVIFGQVGEDIIYGGQGGDFLFGGDDTDTIYGGTETDLLFGGMGGDVLFGEDGDDRIEGNEGGDFIFGGDGVDTVFGGDDVDQIHGEGDGDVLNGGAGDDNIFGGAGGDFLFGDTGSDRLNGGIGNDQLYGGSNGMTDPGTQDVFVFETGFGIDTIHDYEVGVDRIEFSGITGLNDFADLTVNEINGDAVLSFGADSITFIGVSASTITANSLDFDFV